jgi:hypothetical protein
MEEFKKNIQILIAKLRKAKTFEEEHQIKLEIDELEEELSKIQ